MECDISSHVYSIGLRARLLWMASILSYERRQNSGAYFVVFNIFILKNQEILKNNT